MLHDTTSDTMFDVSGYSMVHMLQTEKCMATKLKAYSWCDTALFTHSVLICFSCLSLSLNLVFCKLLEELKLKLFFSALMAFHTRVAEYNSLGALSALLSQGEGDKKAEHPPSPHTHTHTHTHTLC